MNTMIIRFVQLVTLLLFTSVSQATPQQLLSELQQMRLSAIEVVTNFYMFTGLDADAKYDRRMQQSAEHFKKSLENANELAIANNASDNMTGISADWTKLSELLMENRKDMLTQGFPEVLLVDEMDRASQGLVKKITATYQQVQQGTGITPPEIVQKSRSLALLMEEITAQYAARATTNLGQVFMGNSERTLGQMADEFQVGLDELRAMLKGKQADNVLKSIDSKWKFMSNSVKNYNENTVLFLVVSYNDRILMHLKELDERFQ